MLRSTLKLLGVPRGDARKGEISSPIRKLDPIYAIIYLGYLVEVLIPRKKLGWLLQPNSLGNSNLSFKPMGNALRKFEVRL